MDAVTLGSATGHSHQGVWREALGAVYGSAVLFPGVRYTPAHPLLHFTTKVLRSSGFEVLEVWFDYSNIDLTVIEPAALHELAWADGQSALDELYAHGAEGARMAIGKSLGTVHLAALSLGDLLAGMGSVWLTPLIAREGVFQALRRQDDPTLVVAGTRDPATPPELLADLEVGLHAGVDLVRIEDGDHALERPAPSEAVEALGEVVMAVADFVANQHDPNRPEHGNNAG